MADVPLPPPPLPASQDVTALPATSIPAPAVAVPTTAVPPPPNAKQTAKKISKAKEDAIAMRKHLWPTVTDEHLWLLDDKRRKGFSSIPRVMPILMNMIGDASKHVSAKSVPAGRSYLVLWCRVFGEGFVEVENEAIAASEAGYTGERSVSTWREHIRVLKELGFIDYRPGQAGPMQFILLFNPYPVAKALRNRKWVQEVQYTSLLQRAIKIGASSDINIDTAG
jgi:hypothetical protein